MLVCFRRRAASASALFLVMVVAASCDRRTVVPDAPTADAGPAALLLTAVTGGPLGLPFGSTANVVVTLTDLGGAPRSGEVVSFALEGSAADSSLTNLEAVTDADGHATIALRAGERPASFRLRANHLLASPIWIDVTVAASFGRLIARPQYTGPRSVMRWTVTLFSNGDCATAQAMPDAGVMRVLTSPVVEARFEALPTDASYTVLVRGFAAGSDTVSASGCVARVGVLSDAETIVDVPVASAPLVLEGAYEMTVTLDATLAVQAPLEGFASEATGRLGTPVDDASRFFDALENELAGNSVALAELSRLRASGGETALAALFVVDVSAPTESVGGLLGAAVEALYDLRAEATLDFSTGDVPTLTLRRFVAGGHSTTPLPLVSMSTTDVAIAATFAAETDAVVLDRLSMSLPLGRALAAVLDAQRSLASLDSRGALFGGEACTTLEAYVATDPALSCDADCSARACAQALDATLAEALGDGALLDALRDRFELSGTLEVRDVDADLNADTLHGALAGAFVGLDVADEGPVSGELSAARPFE